MSGPARTGSSRTGAPGTGPGAALDRWLFAPDRGVSLSLCRVALGAVLIYGLLLLAPHLTLLFGDAGLVPLAVHQQAAWWPAPTLLSLTGASPTAVWALWGLCLVAALGFTAGLFTRVAAVLLYIGLLSLHDANTFAVNGADVVGRNLVFWFCLAPGAGARFLSLDAWRRRRRGLPAPAPAWPWARRMVQLQVVVLYLGTSSWKLLTPRWHEGTALHEILGSVDYLAPGVEQLLSWPELTVPLSLLVIVSELALGPLLLFRRTRPLGLLIGLGMHGTIALFMWIPVFSAVMWASYLAFLDDDQAAALLARLGLSRAVGEAP